MGTWTTKRVFCPALLLHLLLSCAILSCHRRPWWAQSTTGSYPQENDAKEWEHNGGHFRFPKVNLSTYDGKEDLLPWLTSCYEYFFIRATPEVDRTWMAAVHLTGVDSLWYRQLKNKQGWPSWPAFVSSINAHFGPPSRSN
jgi:hypothetical protein